MDDKRKELKKSCFHRQITEASSLWGDREPTVWGTQETGVLAKEILDSLGKKCAFFISSRPRTDTFCGRPLLTPECLDAEKHYVILSANAGEVYQYLTDRGFEENRDFLLLNLWHDDLEYDGCQVGRGTYGYETFCDLSLKNYGNVVRIGRYTSINRTARVWGNHIAGYVSVHTFLTSMEYTLPSRKIREVVANKPQPPIQKAEQVEIGNDVWIGANVVILPGVKIGDGAIIGAGAVVTHDVEPYAVVGGVPAKVIKFRYPREMIQSFLRIRWWDWSLEQIEQSFELFYQPELFCKTFDIQKEENENG